MKTSKLAILLALAGLVAACADAQNNPKQTIGTLLGTGVGALIGSQVGSGKGKLAAVAIGALGGAYLGSEIGKSLDYVDRQKAGKAEQTALEKNPSGVATSWQNPDTGNSGRVTPKSATQLASGEYCREYEHEIVVDGRTEIAKGTACRQTDGNWRTVN